MGFKSPNLFMRTEKVTLICRASHILKKRMEKGLISHLWLTFEVLCKQNVKVKTRVVNLLGGH